MEPASNWYESVALFYTRLAEQDSPQAGSVIQEIQSICGSRAAMCAAVAIALTKLAVQKDGKLPDMGIYALLLKDYAEALPLLRRAVEVSLPTWNIQNPESLPSEGDYLSDHSDGQPLPLRIHTEPDFNG
jgi:hypothetical protein